MKIREIPYYCPEKRERRRGLQNINNTLEKLSQVPEYCLEKPGGGGGRGVKY